MSAKKKQVPKFRSEDEERAFWESADSTDYVDWNAAEKVALPELKPSLKTISLRLPEMMLAELKALANKRDVPYQSLLKMFLAERIAEELQALSPRQASQQAAAAAAPEAGPLSGNHFIRKQGRSARLTTIGPLLRAAMYGALFIALLSFGSGQLLAGMGVPRPPSLGLVQMAGVVVTLTGTFIALWCVLIFAQSGRGTPIPLDPPRRLVVSGPFRVVRNPMALGVGVALAGVALFYESAQFLMAVVVFMLGIHAMVRFYEEPTLHRTFGSDYVAYCERVNRWVPHLRGAGSRNPGM